MTDAYDRKTWPAYDKLLDTLARACGAGDLEAIAVIYARSDPRVSANLTH
ncbi:hypothetical protein [Leekyejoonella antrihumi]|nr:hypothetical protein [Leekyejoonella antrihumi]